MDVARAGFATHGDGAADGERYYRGARANEYANGNENGAVDGYTNGTNGYANGAKPAKPIVPVAPSRNF